MYPGREIVCLEELREWCGQLVNSKRRTASQLKERFPFVDVSQLNEDDGRWDSEVLEEEASVARRFPLLDDAGAAARRAELDQVADLLRVRRDHRLHLRVGLEHLR